MKVVVLYRPNSEHEAIVRGFIRDFEHQTGHSIESISLDSKVGDDTARLYDITSYPAIIALDNSGKLQKMWQGQQMPMISEVSYYTSTAASF